MGLFDWLFGKGGRADGDRCVACDSTELDILGPQAYRCQMCDYEGGDGYADYQRSLEREQYRDLDVPELQRRAMSILEEGRLKLASVADVGDLGRGTWSNVTIRVTLGGGMGRMAAQQDAEEEARRRVERDVAATFIHQKVLDAVGVVEVLIEKGRDDLIPVLDAARHSSPNLQQAGQALIQMGVALSKA